MRYFKNDYTGAVVTEKEMDEMHLREYEEMWAMQTGSANDFNTEKEFVAYMIGNDADTDFAELDEDGNKIDQ